MSPPGARGPNSVSPTHYTRTHVRGYTVRRRHVPGGPGGSATRTTGDMATANGVASNMCSSLVGGTDKIGATHPSSGSPGALEVTSNELKGRYCPDLSSRSVLVSLL